MMVTIVISIKNGKTILLCFFALLGRMKHYVDVLWDWKALDLACLDCCCRYFHNCEYLGSK